MDSGEQITGTRDEHYNLVSVLYHALHGAETTETYVLDAEAAGDDELAAFLREVQETQRQVAERVKDRLGIGGVAPPGMLEDPLRETETPADAEPVDIRGRAAPEVGLPPEGDVGPEIPPETDVPPDAPPRGTPGGVWGETSPEPPPPGSEEPPPPGPPRDSNAPA